jgi:hypothetical protein
VSSRRLQPEAASSHVIQRTLAVLSRAAAPSAAQAVVVSRVCVSGMGMRKIMQRSDAVFGARTLHNVSRIACCIISVRHHFGDRMGPSSEDAVTTFTVAQGLREIRKQRRRYWLVSALGVPAMVTLGVVWYSLHLPSRWAETIATLSLGVGWLWLSNRLQRRVSEACCPRCGEPYFARRWGPFELHGVFFGSCQHCGLGLRADRQRDRDV